MCVWGDTDGGKRGILRNVPLTQYRPQYRGTCILGYMYIIEHVMLKLKLQLRIRPGFAPTGASA